MVSTYPTPILPLIMINQDKYLYVHVIINKILYGRLGPGSLGQYAGQETESSIPQFKRRPQKAGRTLFGLVGVIGANMELEFFVALQLEVAHHFVEGSAEGDTRGFESPSTLGATETAKMLLLNPYQLTVHGRLCRRARTGSRLRSRAKRSNSPLKVPLAAAYWRLRESRRPPVWAWLKAHQWIGRVYLR
jgi:hypothetical protein